MGTNLHHHTHNRRQPLEGTGIKPYITYIVSHLHCSTARCYIITAVKSYTLLQKIYSVQFWLVLRSAHLLFFARVTVVITIEHMVHKANLCVASAPMQALVGTKERELVGIELSVRWM